MIEIDIAGDTPRIVEAMYGLDDPWRTRFLELTAHLATGNGNGRVPDRVEVETWLRQNRFLRRKLRSLLRTWNGSRGLSQAVVTESHGGDTEE